MELKASTLHAPSERYELAMLKKQSEYFEKNEILKKAFDISNVLILVLNKHRQVVYANRSFSELLGIDSGRNMLGKRPGEIIECIHSCDNAGGCGTSEACRHCNLTNLVLKTINSGDSNTGEVVITTNPNGIELPINMFENITPIEVNNETFYIVALTDISDTKRRMLLERVFFHDIINTSGALRGLLTLLKMDIPDDYKPEVEFVEDAFSGLVDEIITQKQIMEAENNELQVEFITLKSKEVVNSVSKLYMNHDEARKKEIVTDKDSENIDVKSDLAILKRVMGNMIKNALEAAEKNGIVTIGCRRSLEDQNYAEFYVNNKEVMPRDVQLQVFKRSFSTKGTSRGLGTYSMKLFGERYLKGKVGFNSEPGTGTTFYILIPVAV